MQKRATVPFHKWYTLHNLHNFGAIGLGILSLYFQNNAIMNERVPILWSLGYFVVDIWDCAVRQDVTYLLHGVFCLVLGLANYHIPTCRLLRMNSKATLCELSNPFMHLSRRTRKPMHFLLFAMVFTCCRVLWIPWMVRQLVQADMPLNHPIQICLLAFYALNLFWYYKILRILLEGVAGKTAAKES